MTTFSINLTTTTVCLLWLANLSTAFVPRSNRGTAAATGRRSCHASAHHTALNAAIVPGDTVLVVGATGGVGKLVTRKLLNDQFPVRVTSRNVEKARDLLAGKEEDDVFIDVVPLDLIQGPPEQLIAALEGVSGVVVSVGTTAFPTIRWQGGNTPQAIDADAVTELVKAATAVPTMKKICLVTSVGVYRTDEMPFKVLNLFGVLDAKRTGEDALKQAATAQNVDYVIVRPGRLVGQNTNLDFARLMQLEGGAENGVDVASGDALLGDCKRDACAEAIVQALRQEAAKNVDFSLVSNEKPALKDEEWTDVFTSMAK